MTLVVKYCGGCNPRYDRVAFVTKVGEDFPDICIAGLGTVDPDFVLVVCGCFSHCADHEGLSGRFGKMVVTAPKDYEQLHRTLQSVLHGNA